jgi:hypothetical protein
MRNAHPFLVQMGSLSRRRRLMNRFLAAKPKLAPKGAHTA